MKTILYNKIFKLSFALILLFGLSCCQPVKVSQSYCTPHFTKGNQFEGGANIGASGFNGYVTYTPLKYFALQVNGFSYPGNFYTYTLEGAAGFYLPYKKYVFAINGGYGKLDCDWELRDFRGYSGYTLNHLSYYSENTFIHAYYSHKKDSTNKFYNGFSFKFSNSFDHYRYGSALANSSSGFPHLNNRTYFTQSYEFTYFQKKRLANKLYCSLNAGFRYTDNSPDTDVFGLILRFGLVLKL